MDIPTSAGTKFDHPYIEEDLYSAVLTSIDEGPLKKFQDGNEAKTLILNFEIRTKGEPGEIVTIPFFGYLPATPKNKLGKALMSLGIKEEQLTNGSKIDGKSLIGKQAIVLIETYEKGDDKRSCVTKVKSKDSGKDA